MIVIPALYHDSVCLFSECDDDDVEVKCLVDPCQFASCSIPNATCL